MSKLTKRAIRYRPTDGHILVIENTGKEKVMCKEEQRVRLFLQLFIRTIESNKYSQIYFIKLIHTLCISILTLTLYI